jgi:hypothetical protein
MMNVKKKDGKRFGAIVLSLILLLSLVFPYPVMADQTAADQTTAASVYAIHKTGDDKENFVIVIMGEGYTREQQEQFLKDATAKAQGLLKWSPYKEYSDRINIYAVQTVSNETGVGVMYGESNPDTYFHVQAFGKSCYFAKDGKDKAEALRAELESRYLDTGAAVGTIHIICNTTANIGSSSNALFSFSANSDENEQGDVMTHEISHSIGRLGDEYDKKMQGENISDTSDPDKIKWHKMLGFRGIGITAAGTETVFAPSRVCMMRDLGNPFCEVCKMELARRLNNRDYVSRQASVYVCDPEITIPHSRTGTLDRDSDQYRIDETNITKANGKDLEFRTVVQNMVDAKQHLKITFRIIGADHTVKYEKEETYTVPPLSNWYDPDAARESLSVTLPAVTGLVSGDRLEGKIIDEDTGKILADNQTAGQAWSTVTIRYMLQNEDGTETTVPDTAPATVYVPKNSAYTLRSPDLYGYTCVGNSANQGEINITEDRQEITYYYRKNSEMPEIQTVPVRVTYDGKPHTFDIKQEDGVQISYSLTENGSYTQTEMPFYTEAGQYKIYFKAEKASFIPTYGEAVLEIEKASTSMQLTAKNDTVKGAGTVELQLCRQGIPEDAGIKVTCDVSGITLEEKGTDHWMATLPNETKTYTFTACYNGNGNYTGSKADCQVRVTADHSQTGGGSGGSSGGSSSGGSGGISGGGSSGGSGGSSGGSSGENAGGSTDGSSGNVSPDSGTLPAPDHAKEEPGNVTPPPAADTSVSVKDINVKAKTAVKNNTVKVKNIAAVLKKEITKAEKEQGGRIKDLSVEITFDTGKAKNWKNLHLEMDKQAVNLLVKKNVKEWKVNGGNVNLTFDSKALKELKKEMNTAVVIKMKQADKKNLSARAGKIIGKRPVYDFSVTGIKKKQSSVLKKGRIRVAVSYNASKKEKDKKIFAYKIDKYGAAVKIPGSYYDSDTKTVNFVSRGFFTVAVGCEK